MIALEYDVDDVYVSKLDAEIKALNIQSATFLGVAFCDCHCCVIFDSTPNASDEAAVDAAVAAHIPTISLTKVKHAKCEAIDLRTVILIEQGFTYGGKVFSMSIPAQIKMAGLNQIRSDPIITYPITWNTIDDTDSLQLVDAADVLAFYQAGVLTFRSHVDAGTALKALVRAATTIAEVEAIEDNR